MNSDFRNRMVLPFVLPLAVLLGVAVFVGGLALILLYNPRDVGLMVALVVAAGFMVAFSLANSVDEDQMTLGRRAVILSVGVLPLLGGVAASIWTVNGGVPADELASTVPGYYEPEAAAPEGALAGAKNAESFCVFEDPENQTAETCTDTSELTFPAQPDAEAFAYVFNNLNAGVPHNLQLFELAGSADAPEAGAPIFGAPDGAEVITGIAEITYEVPAEIATALEQDAQFYYNCVVHPVMQGVLTIGPPAEGEA
jgi:hypothetical protein